MRINSTTRTLSAATLAAAMLGCGAAVPADRSADGTLDELTIADVVAGFQDFAAGDDAALTISDEFLAELEALQDQRSAGEITDEAFGQRLLELVGAGNPRRAFGGFGFFGGPVRDFGGRWGSRGHGDRAAALDLSDDQRVQARAIFEALHDDIEALRSTAHEKVRAQLTDEQVALLDARQGERIGGPRRLGRRGPGPRFGFHRAGDGDEDEETQTSPFLDRLTDELGLTDDQVAAITSIRQALRDAIKARHQEARVAFRALLTEEQLAILDEIEA